MKETTKNNNPRRHVRITENLYKQVAKESIEKGVDYGTVIDTALEYYFKKNGVKL